MSSKNQMLAAARRSESEGGFSTVEFAIAMAAIVLGLLSYIGSVVASSKMSMQTRARIAANIEMAAAIEEFRELAADDFVGTADRLDDVEIEDGLSSVDGIKVHRKVILDETAISPPMDLNGDGDTNDKDLNASEVTAAYLVTTVKWIGPSGEQSVSWPTVIARGEVDPNWQQNRAHEAAAAKQNAAKSTDDGSDYDHAEYSSGNLSGSFTFEHEAPVHVVGVTVVSQTAAQIWSIRVNGERAFRTRTTAPTTGQTIETTPFALQPGANSLDGIQLSTGEGESPDIRGETVNVVFHTESGETLSFGFDV